MRAIVGWGLLLACLWCVPASADTYPVSAFPSAAERAFWRKTVKVLMFRPGCCGACPALTPDDYRSIAPVIATRAEDSPSLRAVWARYSTRLARIVNKQDGNLYHQFEAIRLDEMKGASK